MVKMKSDFFSTFDVFLSGCQMFCVFFWTVLNPKTISICRSSFLPNSKCLIFFYSIQYLELIKRGKNVNIVTIQLCSLNSVKVENKLNLSAHIIQLLIFPNVTLVDNGIEKTSLD